MGGHLHGHVHCGLFAQPAPGFCGGGWPSVCMLSTWWSGVAMVHAPGGGAASFMSNADAADDDGSGRDSAIPFSTATPSAVRKARADMGTREGAAGGVASLSQARTLPPFTVWASCRCSWQESKGKEAKIARA